MELTTSFAHDLNLRFGDDGRLFLEQEGRWIPVALTECFPWTRPGEFISLRDREKKEVALVRELTELSESSQAALRKALEVSGFAFEIVRLIEIEKDFELRRWKVETRQGERRFVTKLEDWPRVLDDGRVLIEDLAGDVYVIPDRTALDRKSQQLIWSYVA
jgi:hypothetical protein